jgi:hypothetical protein
MLSGERRMKSTSGSRSSTERPDSTAAVRHPSFNTASATSGKIRTPPIAWPVCTIAIARPRLRRNQWATTARVA